MLWTCVASTDRDLTTTGQLKALVLGATATSTVEDGRFSLAIRAASAWAESYLGYPLTVASYGETAAAFGRRNLMLTRYPIRSVDLVLDTTSTEDAVELSSTMFRLENPEAGMLSRDGGWEWTAPELPGGLVPSPAVGQEQRPWFVSYSAGYTYAGLDTGSANWSTGKGTTSTGRTLPEDIEQAVLMKAQTVYENTDGVDFEQLGDLSVRYNTRSADAGAAPEPYEALLMPYRAL
jgi:hypothetical protein